MNSTNRTLVVIAKALPVAGILLFLAGSGFGLMPANYANFLAISCFVLSGFVWSLWGRARTSKAD